MIAACRIAGDWSLLAASATKFSAVGIQAGSILVLRWTRRSASARTKRIAGR